MVSFRLNMTSTDKLSFFLNSFSELPINLVNILYILIKPVIIFKHHTTKNYNENKN